MGNSIFTISNDAFKALKLAHTAMTGLDPRHVSPLTDDQNRQVTKAFYLLNKAETELSQYGTNWFTRVIRRIFCDPLIRRVNRQMKTILPFMKHVQVYNEKADKLDEKLNEARLACPEEKTKEFNQQLSYYMESYLHITKNLTKEMILLNGALASGKITQEQFEQRSTEIVNKQQYLAGSVNLQKKLDELLDQYVPGTRIDLSQL